MSIRSLCLSYVLLVAFSAGRAADPQRELDLLQKKLLDQMLNGKPTPDELARTVAEMNKLLRQQLPNRPPLELPGVEGRPARVPPLLEPLVRAVEVAVPEPGLPEPAAPQGPADREALEKKLKEFDEAIDKLKDDPDAQAELKKARDEFKKAVEEELRKGGGGGLERPRPNPIDRPFRPLPVPEVRAMPFPAVVDPNARLVRPSGPVRLGVVFEKPAELLTEHLNLPPEVGVVIVEVQPGSPADKAGLRKNDVVVKLGGRDAPSELTRFQELVADLRAGEKLEAVIYRKGKREVLAGLELSPVKR